MLVRWVRRKDTMDRKVIAIVGAVMIVGAAVYGVATGTVLPSVEEITEEPPETGEKPEGERGDAEDIEGVADETEDAKENVTDTGPEPLPVVCEQRRATSDAVRSTTSPLPRVRSSVPSFSKACYTTG